MTTSATRRKRPHPARRARRIAGSVTIAGMALLTAGMAVAGKLPTSPSVTTASTQSATGTASSTAGRSVTVAAVPATASAQSNTSTHAS